jgi:hypothetical protein
MWSADILSQSKSLVADIASHLLRALCGWETWGQAKAKRTVGLVSPSGTAEAVLELGRRHRKLGTDPGMKVFGLIS